MRGTTCSLGNILEFIFDGPSAAFAATQGSRDRLAVVVVMVVKDVKRTALQASTQRPRASIYHECFTFHEFIYTSPSSDVSPCLHSSLRLHPYPLLLPHPYLFPSHLPLINVSDDAPGRSSSRNWTHLLSRWSRPDASLVDANLPLRHPLLVCLQSRFLDTMTYRYHRPL